MFLYVKCFVYVFYSAHPSKLLRETPTFQGFEEMEAGKAYSFSKVTQLSGRPRS